VFTTAEITRLAEISDFYAPSEWPGVIAFKFYYGAANEEIADFWTTTFGVIEPLTSRTIVTGVVYQNNINYTTKDSITDMQSDNQSFYWDATNQILYIHLNPLHNLDYIDANFDYGVSIGLTNDRVRYFEGRTFRPLLVSFPSILTSVDKFNYDQLSFIIETLVFDNNSRFFNQFKDTPIYGNKVAIKTGEDGDEYGDLIERATYFVEDYNFSAFEFKVDIQDVRKTLTAQVPSIILNVDDYPDLGDTNIGKTLPFGYGPLRDVPGLCINENAIDAGTDADFKFLEVLIGSTLADITVYVKDSNDVWIEDTGISVNWATGIVTVPDAKAVSGSTYNSLPVKAHIKGIVTTYGSDPIKDMNARWLGLPYDSSGYDTTEWELEEVFLAPVSLYMDITKDIYEWIREVQALSSVGFRYTNTADNKRTIRVDNPNRDVELTVPTIHIKDPAKVEAESNREDVFNKIYIGYNKSILNDTAPRVEDLTYFDESFAEYKIETVYNKDSGLETEAEATDRAVIQAEDYFKIRKVFQLELMGQQYLDLKLYDVINVNLILLKKKFTNNLVFFEVIASAPTKQEVITAVQKYQEVISPVTIEEIGDIYFGLVRGQVVSKQPDYALKVNRIKLRERPYSTVWEGIYG
jgi:hypothetical protein